MRQAYALLRISKMAEACPGTTGGSSTGSPPCTSGMTPTRTLSPSWSTIIIDTGSRCIGARVPRHPPMDSASVPGGRGEQSGQVNLRYGNEPGVLFYCHLLGFRFASRIRDLADKRLYVPGKERDHPALAPLMIRKLAGYLRQNSLHTALREVGRIERTFHAGVDERPRAAQDCPGRAQQRRGLV